ncbi:hypothetical protein AHAS_Ahas11G0070900 [Arachis hypogaea]
MEDHFPKKLAYNKLSEEEKEIIDCFKGATLASLTKSAIDMSVERGGEPAEIQEDFCHFLSTDSPTHKLPALHVDTVQQWDWASHVLSFLRNRIKAQREGKKLSVDGCVFVLMLIYFHESKFPRLEVDNAPEPPWVAYWTWKKLVDQIASETTDGMSRIEGRINRRKEGGKENSFSEGGKEGKEEERKKKENCHFGFVFGRRQEEEEIEKTPPKKRQQPQRVAKKQTKIRKIIMTADYKFGQQTCVTNIDELGTVCKCTKQHQDNNFGSPLEPQQQPCEEPPARQSKQEAPLNVFFSIYYNCPPEPQDQAYKETSARQTDQEPPQCVIKTFLYRLAVLPVVGIEKMMHLPSAS